MEKLQLLLAMQDDDFQKILQNDEILNQLQKLKFSSEQQYWQLMTVFSGKNQIKNVRFNFITLGLWSFLYSIKNPFVVGGDKTKKDIDLFMFLLHEGFQGITEKLYQQSKDFCLINQIDYESAEDYIYKMIMLAFRPLDEIPQIQSGEKASFNLEWLTMVVSIVCRLCNCTRQFALYQMSCTEAFYYVIQNLKENDIKNQIKRRNRQQIDAEIYKRTLWLGKKYYQQKYK